MRKITVHVPDDLLERAQQATGEGITDTVKKALQVIAASRAYEQLLAMRGKVRFSVDLKKLREDRG